MSPVAQLAERAKPGPCNTPVLFRPTGPTDTTSVYGTEDLGSTPGWGTWLPVRATVGRQGSRPGDRRRDREPATSNSIVKDGPIGDRLSVVRIHPGVPASAVRSRRPVWQGTPVP